MELSMKCLCGVVGIISLYLLYIYFVKSPPKKKKKIINEGFEPSKTFQGRRKNKVFKLGKKGLGYYLDKKMK
tara:strand:+ start:599 stop:814 length:216 start_codon:yes stop_codon:yes gene_type:complete